MDAGTSARLADYLNSLRDLSPLETPFSLPGENPRRFAVMFNKEQWGCCVILSVGKSLGLVESAYVGWVDDGKWFQVSFVGEARRNMRHPPNGFFTDLRLLRKLIDRLGVETACLEMLKAVTREARQNEEYLSSVLRTLSEKKKEPRLLQGGAPGLGKRG